MLVKQVNDTCVCEGWEEWKKFRYNVILRQQTCNHKRWHIFIAHSIQNRTFSFQKWKTHSRTVKSGKHTLKWMPWSEHCFESFKPTWNARTIYTYRKIFTDNGHYYGFTVQCECRRNHFPMANHILFQHFHIYTQCMGTKWHSALFQNHKIQCAKMHVSRFVHLHFLENRIQHQLGQLWNF